MCISKQAKKELILLNMKLMLLQAQLDLSAKALGVQLPIVKEKHPEQ